MLALIVIITYILQTTIIPCLNIRGVFPNLFLIVTCSISFLFGSTVGGTVGFSLGILQDFYQGRAIGIYAFLCMYIGILLGSFNKRFFKDNYIVAISFIAISTIFYESVVFVFSAIAYNQSFVFSMFIWKILLITFINVIASIVIYPILLKMNIGIEIDRNIFGR